MSTAAAASAPPIGGNLYPKYTTRNPIARLLVANFLATLDDLVRRSGARDIHEVGCGEGFLATRLAAAGHTVRGSDLSAEAIDQARARAHASGLAAAFAVRDLYALEPTQDAAELVVCCEVLEHLPEPAGALEILAGLARPHLIVSVPREPLWRTLNFVRGRYWGALGNTPGHLQHWSSARFVRLLRGHVEVLEVRRPLPWTMALCRAY